MPASWNELLLQKLSLFPKGRQGRLRICLVGVGSELRGDDSAGICLARALLQDERITRMPNLLIVDGGLAPENHTGALRAFRPDLVLLVDAAHMDEPPGTVAWVPVEAIDGMSASSHSLPLSMLAGYLTFELGCEVAVLAVQPGQNDFDTDPSPAVRNAVEHIQAEIGRALLPSNPAAALIPVAPAL